MDFEDLGWSERNSCGAEFHADAAGGLDVYRRMWVCFPVVFPETQGGLAWARRPWAESAALSGLKRSQEAKEQMRQTVS